MATTYRELEQDHELRSLVLKRLAADHGIAMIQAIRRFGEAGNAATLRLGREASVDEAIREAGGVFTLAQVTAAEDAEVRALEAHAVTLASTPAPTGETDELGRYRIDAATAAKIVSDEVFASQRWLQAKEAGLEGARDRGAWTKQDSLFATAGFDYLKTQQAIKRDRELKAAERRGKSRIMTVRPTSPNTVSLDPPELRKGASKMLETAPERGSAARALARIRSGMRAGAPIWLSSAEIGEVRDTLVAVDGRDPASLGRAEVSALEHCADVLTA